MKIMFLILCHIDNHKKFIKPVNPKEYSVLDSPHCLILVSLNLIDRVRGFRLKMNFKQFDYKILFANISLWSTATSF